MEDNYNSYKYDDALSGILQCEGQILPFLEAIYSFLYRRTDFYRIQHSSNEKMGFPPGVAKKIADAAFKKYHKLAQQDEEKLQRLGKQQQQKLGEDVELVPVGRELEIPGMEPRVEEVVAAPSQPPTATAQLPEPPSLRLQVADKPICQMTQEDFQRKPESYNGAVRDNYSWGQNIREVDVRIKVDPRVTAGKMVRVNIEAEHLRAECLSQDGGRDWVTLVNGDLAWRVNVEESLWTLVPGEHIHVCLEKVQERWWENLLKDEPAIDIQKIDNSRPFADLDEAAQYKIEELMYNERQKALGLPSPQQDKINDILKEAWNKDGSPFQGTPFDPSAINISNPQDLASHLK